MKAKIQLQELQEELKVLSASIAKILRNPRATAKLKELLVTFLSASRNCLPDQAEEEIEILEIERILPEVLSRVR